MNSIQSWLFCVTFILFTGFIIWLIIRIRYKRRVKKQAKFENDVEIQRKKQKNIK